MQGKDPVSLPYDLAKFSYGLFLVMRMLMAVFSTLSDKGKARTKTSFLILLKRFSCSVMSLWFGLISLPQEMSN